MRQWKAIEIETKIVKDLDLQEEQFITRPEIRSYINEGIALAEADIHNIYEDYFVTTQTITLTAGTTLYSLPDDIYANKIRSVTYEAGTPQARRLKRARGFDHDLSVLGDGTPDLYEIVNPSRPPTDPAGSMIALYPSPNLSGGRLTFRYIRNAAYLVGDDDYCDIPEFVSFVIQFAKFRCYEKEGHPNTALASTALQELKKLMVETLTEKVADNDTFIEADLSHYEDQT